MKGWRSYRHSHIYSERETYSRRRWRLSRPFRWVLGLMGLVVGLGWFIFDSPVFAIETISLSGELTPALTERLMTLKGQNLFRISEANLTTKLQEIEPTVSSLRLTRGLPNELQVTVTRRHPALIWQVGEVLWALDEQGVAFALDPTLAPGIPQVIDHRAPTVTAGVELIPPSIVSFIRQVFGEVPSRIGGKLVRAEVDETVVSIKLITEWGWAIYLETTRPLIPQLDNLAIVLRDYRDQIHEYVDMRLPGWGYVK